MYANKKKYLWVEGEIYSGNAMLGSLGWVSVRAWLCPSPASDSRIQLSMRAGSCGPFLLVLSIPVEGARRVRVPYRERARTHARMLRPACIRPANPETSRTVLSWLPK
jgi:hypothetical protein